MDGRAGISLCTAGFGAGSAQYRDFPEMAGKKIRAWFGFSTSKGEQVKLKMGLSAVSMEGALANLKAGIPGWDFDKVRTKPAPVGKRVFAHHY